MKTKIIIIGSGFSGLSCSLLLRKYKPLIIEQDDVPGGLAASFNTKGQRLERFYHHWFNSDKYIIYLINFLKQKKNLINIDSRSGMYFNNNFFKLSTPFDLLKFTAIPFFSRIRLGFLVIYVRFFRSYKSLESITAKLWLEKIVGRKAYEVVWAPLLKGKFGPYANKISAVWFWNKLILRGSTRSKNGNEQLMYFKGGFASLVDKLVIFLKKNGVNIFFNEKVEKIVIKNNKVYGVKTNKKLHLCDYVICTTPIPIYKKFISDQKIPKSYISFLNKTKYIGNVCLILELDRSLSSYYWINVNDPSFPFVGIIEHTNFINKDMYGDKHIVYISKYLPVTNKLYKFSDSEYLEYAIPFIKKMFPDFESSWISNYYLWRSPYSQPLVMKNYSKNIPAMTTPIENLYLSTMAQIYPEDRGTNYAIKYGFDVANLVKQKIKDDEK